MPVLVDYPTERTDREEPSRPPGRQKDRTENGNEVLCESQACVEKGGTRSLRGKSPRQADRQALPRRQPEIAMHRLKIIIPSLDRMIGWHHVHGSPQRVVPCHSCPGLLVRVYLALPLRQWPEWVYGWQAGQDGLGCGHGGVMG